MSNVAVEATTVRTSRSPDVPTAQRKQNKGHANLPQVPVRVAVKFGAPFLLLLRIVSQREVVTTFTFNPCVMSRNAIVTGFQGSSPAKTGASSQRPICIGRCPANIRLRDGPDAAAGFEASQAVVFGFERHRFDSAAVQQGRNES
jgi:hypothetical protein